MSAIGSGVAAVLAGVLDGLGASRDQNAGRHWDTPGIGLTGAPVLDWGWAPGVQVGALVTGVAAEMNDLEWGLGLTAAGMGMFARALAFKLAQRGKATAQGQTWRHPNPPVPPGTPGRSYVSNNFGALADGTNVPPGAPQSHYVSTYLPEYAHGARVPPFVNYDRASYDNPAGLDQFGGRISGARVPPFVTYQNPLDNPDFAVPEGFDRLGGRVSGYLDIPGYRADGTNVSPGVPQSHYVSTFGALAPG